MHVADCYREYLIALVGAAWASFLFGWHVHEKAVLVILLPLNLLAFATPRFRGLAFYTTTIGHYSLMPLIPTKAETPVVVFMFLSFTAFHWLALFRVNPAADKEEHRTNRFMQQLCSLHLWGLIPIYIISFIFWPLWPVSKRLPFVPLMMTSMYTAFGLCFAFLYFIQMNLRYEDPMEPTLKCETREHQKNTKVHANKKTESKKLKKQ